MVLTRRHILFVTLLAAAITIPWLLSCDSDSPSGPSKIDDLDPLDTKTNWFKVDDTKYDIAYGAISQGISTTTSDGSEGTGSGIVLTTSSGLPILTIAFTSDNIKTGTWSLPSKEVYHSVMGHNSKLYFFVPFTSEEYLASDQCKNASTMIGGTLKVSKNGNIYEIRIEGVKLTTTIHRTDDVNDPHPEGTVTLSGYFKGTLTTPIVDKSCNSSAVLPKNFMLKYDAMFLKEKLAKIGDDFYNSMDDEFYKKNLSQWALYEMNLDSSWTNKNQTVCPYTKSIMFWNPSIESSYNKGPSEMVLDINCRKFSFSSSDMSATYWVHPDYDIIMRSMIKYGSIEVEYTATSFSTNITSWSEVGITAP